MIHPSHPKVGFVRCPTPFEEMARLRRDLEVMPRLFIKRDDLTDVGLGGNKNRKLEYVIQQALEAGADTIVTWGGLQSNHCRQTLAYCCRLGLACHLVLAGSPQENPQGNLLLFDIMGAQTHFQPKGTPGEEACHLLMADLRKQGRKPFYIPLGASTPLGCLGYVEAVAEIARQATELEAEIRHLYLATGSAGTQAGALVGARLYLPECQVHGVSVMRNKEDLVPQVLALARDVADLLGAGLQIKENEVLVHDDYIGSGYAVPSQKGLDAIRRLARQEGILLDPVYTGKAMACFIDHVQSGVLKEASAVAFLHTGGSPALFAYADSFTRSS